MYARFKVKGELAPLSGCGIRRLSTSGTRSSEEAGDKTLEWLQKTCHKTSSRSHCKACSKC